MSKRNHIQSLTVPAVVAATLATVTSVATAATFNWVGGGAAWGNALNWGGGPPGVGDTAVFLLGPTGVVDLGGGQNVDSITFQNGFGTNYTIGTPGQTLTFNNVNTPAGITQTGGGTNTMAARLTTAGNIPFTGTVNAGRLILANTAAGGASNSFGTGSTFNVGAAGTLEARFGGFAGLTTGSNSLDTASVTLSGGTLVLKGETQAGFTALFYDHRAGERYITTLSGGAAGTNGAPEIANNRRATAFASQLVPAVLGAPNAGASSAVVTTSNWSNTGGGFGGDPPFAGAGFGSGDNIFTRFTGTITITTAGNYTFNTRSDDGSLLAIDGVVLVDNNNYQGATTRTSAATALTAGTHTIDVWFYEGGGGAGLQFQYSGADTGNVMVDIPAAVVQSKQAIANLGNDVNLTSSTTSTITLQDVVETRMGSLNWGASAGLNANGVGLLRFNTTNFAGTGNQTIVLNTTNEGDVALGALVDAGATGVLTIQKNGPANLILDSLSAPATSGRTLNWLVGGGRIVTKAGAGVNPLGVGSTIAFGTAGTGWTIIADNAIPVFNNAVSLTASAAIETVLLSPSNTTGGAQLSGNISIGAGAVLTLDPANKTEIHVSGLISGSGALTKVAVGDIRLSSSNTFSGATTLTGGTVFVESNNAFGTVAGGTTVNNDTTVLLQNVNYATAEAITLNDNGATGRFAALQGAFGTTNTWAGAITLASSATVGADGGGASLTISGAVSTGAAGRVLTVDGPGTTTISGVISNAGRVAKIGAGTFNVNNSAANTYSGGTAVNGGLMNLNNASGVGTGAISIAAGTLRVNHVNAMTGAGNISLASNGTTGANLEFNAAGTVNYAGTQITVDNGTIRVSQGNVVMTNTILRADPGAAYVNGLREGFINGTGNIDTASPNPSNGPLGFIQQGIRLAQTNVKDANNWGDNQTWIYTGQIYIPDGFRVAFGENIDDRVRVVIDGRTIINDATWNLRTTSGAQEFLGGEADPLRAGTWYDIDIRLQNGGGGAGAVTDNSETTAGRWNGAAAPSGKGVGILFTADPGFNSLFGSAYLIPDNTNGSLSGVLDGGPLFRTKGGGGVINIEGGARLQVRQVTGIAGPVGGFLMNFNGNNSRFDLLDQGAATADAVDRITVLGGSMTATLYVGTNHTLTANGITINPGSPGNPAVLVKSGTGTMRVGLDQSGPAILFNGEAAEVHVTAGALYVRSDNPASTILGNGTIRVFSGATYGGVGTVVGSSGNPDFFPGLLQVQNNGTFAPGDPILNGGVAAVQSEGFVNFQAGGRFAWQLNALTDTALGGAADTNWDSLSIINAGVTTMDIGGAVFLPQFIGSATAPDSNAFWDLDRRWEQVIALPTGALFNGMFTIDNSAWAAQGSFSFEITSYNDPFTFLPYDALDLVWTPIPEPGTWAALIAGGAGLALLRRRMRARRGETAKSAD